MRKILLLIVTSLAACSAADKEVLTTSVDVDQSELVTLLGDIDKLTDKTLPVDEILALAISTPMDAELQDRYTISFNGADEEIQIHVWREQVDWVHVYFSTTSKDLFKALEKVNNAHARSDEP